MPYFFHLNQFILSLYYTVVMHLNDITRHTLTHAPPATLTLQGLAVTPEFVALLEEIGPSRELDVTHGRAIAKSIND